MALVLVRGDNCLDLQTEAAHTSTGQAPLDNFERTLVSDYKDFAKLIKTGLKRRSEVEGSFGLGHILVSIRVAVHSLSESGVSSAVRMAILNLVSLEREQDNLAHLEHVLLSVSRASSGSDPPRALGVARSALTRLLEESLGGKARVAVVCCVSPAQAQLKSTQRELALAQSLRVDPGPAGYLHASHGLDASLAAPDPSDSLSLADSARDTVHAANLRLGPGVSYASAAKPAPAGPHKLASPTIFAGLYPRGGPDDGGRAGGGVNSAMTSERGAVAEKSEKSAHSRGDDAGDGPARPAQPHARTQTRQTQMAHARAAAAAAQLLQPAPDFVAGFLRSSSLQNMRCVSRLCSTLASVSPCLRVDDQRLIGSASRFSDPTDGFVFERPPETHKQGNRADSVCVNAEETGSRAFRHLLRFVFLANTQYINRSISLRPRSNAFKYCLLV